ncbi:hypothetical protein ACS0TY_033126 [Phlomoides rotata]
MVSKKRLDCGLNGYRPPIIPKAPRSIRRRRPPKNTVEDTKLCAFELLADVAGKLLQESDSSVSSTVDVQLGIPKEKNEKVLSVDEKASRLESFDHRSCAESSFDPETSIQKLPLAENDSVSEHASLCASSNILKKFDSDSKLGICEINNTEGCLEHSQDDKNQVDKLHKGNTSTVKDPNEECVNSNMLIKSDGSVQLPLYRDPIPDALLQKHRNNVKLGIRDDDENSFGCKKPSPKIGLSRHRRIRKMLTSKYRKIAPKMKSCELYHAGERVKSFYQYRKRIYTRDRCPQAPIKKRKLFDHRYEVTYDQETSSNSISSLPEKGRRIDKSSTLNMVKGHKNAKDPHVKFSIKSFKVPELYIEVPETESVGSLKRSVMEAVTAILGSGIRVGVFLQGKKVRGDNRTLQQAGISQNNNLDSLSFALEPCFTHASPSKTTQKLPSVLPCEEDQEFPRSPATPMIDSGISNASVELPFVAKVDDNVDPNEFISTSETPSNETMDGSVSYSKALVPVSPTNSETLAVVPANPKPRRSELSQRRIRRPFSVGEVEALVEAVEKLGTGRWRDVKIGAFENADHRTYVDLKDKWKTLVHTASISPHQRRGEPVPQELLDRVLSAHTYWSQHQSRQHGGKQSTEPLKVVDSCEIVAA